MAADFPRLLVIDGGMGSEVVRRHGIKFKDPLWSSRVSRTNENIVKDIHRDYMLAGADIVMTNTYMPRIENLMNEFSLNYAEATEFMRNAARSTCKARDEFWADEKNKQGRLRPLVAAAIGPFSTGTPLRTDYAGQYIESTSKEELAAGHREKARALLAGGVDMLAFETIPAAKEGEAICDLMKEFPTAKAWITFCCKDGEHVCHGEKFSEAVLTTLDSDVVFGVGVNCSKPEYVTSLLKEIPDVIKEKKTIVVYPNNGQVFDTVNKKWVGDIGCLPLHEYLPTWLSLGANWIGGCCNVAPEHIKNVRTEMDKHLKSISK